MSLLEEEETPEMCMHRENNMLRIQEKKQAGQTKHTNTLILDSQPLDLWENKFLLFL